MFSFIFGSCCPCISALSPSSLDPRLSIISHHQIGSHNLSRTTNNGTNTRTHEKPGSGTGNTWKEEVGKARVREGKKSFDLILVLFCFVWPGLVVFGGASFSLLLLLVDRLPPFFSFFFDYLCRINLFFLIYNDNFSGHFFEWKMRSGLVCVRLLRKRMGIDW